MLHKFIDKYRAELIESCRAKVAKRRDPPPTVEEIEHGIPWFIGKLIATLRAEHGAGVRPMPNDLTPADLVSGARKHGKELLRHGFTVHQVVHDYGDLCQAITEMAIERGVSVSTDEFRILNRCLDNAIADAVTEFSRNREEIIAETGDRSTTERLGFLAHELRNFLNIAMLSSSAIRSGAVATNGATSAMLDRSLIGLRDVIDRALAEVRLGAGAVSRYEDLSVAEFIEEVRVAATLEARATERLFTVGVVDAELTVRVDKQMLYSALSNLLQNAFKFTRLQVSLKAYRSGDRVLIEVEDQCGGLRDGMTLMQFRAFEQFDPDRSGLGLGLSIAHRAVDAIGGALRVCDKPGVGCVFTIDLPACDKADRE